MALTPEDFHQLEEMDRDANRRLRESEVVKHLLPHLIPDPQNPNKTALEIYVAAAGHPTRMIDVVADNDPEKVLYTIPPIVSSTPMVIRSIDANPDTDVSALTAQFEAQITVDHPGMVIDSYVQRLMQLNYSPADAVSTLYARMWALIYKRYNIPLERLFGEQAGEVEASIAGVEVVPSGDQAAKTKGQFIDDLDEEDFDPV